MILDKQTLFSEDQAVTASAASTNVYDTGVAGEEAGIGGYPKTVFITVTETFATLTSLQIGLEMDTASAFSSATAVLLTEDFVAADLVAGKVISFTIPQNCDERYLRLYYTVTGSNATAGKFTAGITFGTQAHYGS